MPWSVLFFRGAAAGVRAFEPGDEDPGDGLPTVPGGVSVAEGVSLPPFLICASAPPIFPCIRFISGWDNGASAGVSFFARSGLAGGNTNGEFFGVRLSVGRKRFSSRSCEVYVASELAFLDPRHA